MATLDKEEVKRRKKKKLLLIFTVSMLVLIFLPLFANALCFILYESSGKENPIDSLSYFTAIHNVFYNEDVKKASIFIILGYAMLMIYNYKPVQSIAKTKTIRITDDITIPAPVGDGQFGNSRLMTEEEIENVFDVFEYKDKNSFRNLDKGGVIIQNERIDGKDIYYYLAGDYHTILVAATRAGKGQRVLLKSIWLVLSAGENMLNIDPKGENYHFSHKYAEKTGHEVYVLDFRNPDKGNHFNFMQEINDCIDEGDIVTAIDKTWDIVSVMVGEPKGETIWNDGTCSAIAACILIVSCDAPKDCRNFANVYSFLAYMCEPDEEGMVPLNEYVRDMEDTHPAKLVYQIAKIAPSRTRGSFYTSALATLRLFTNWKIAEMTSKSDFRLNEVINKKSAIYLIIPDDKKTVYPLVSLFIAQHYSALIEVASERGNRLPIRHENLWDEFGNIPKIPNIGSMMSAGAGRGIKNLLVIQDYQQLDFIYEKQSENIKANSELKILLKTSDEKTKKEFSEAIGPYTVQVASAGTNISDNTKRSDISSNSNVSMTGRKVLDTADLGLLKEPFALVWKLGERLAVTHLPGMKGSQAEKDLGLGDIEFNRRLIEKQEAERERRIVSAPKLWGIWKEYQNNSNSNVMENNKSRERVSFLDNDISTWKEGDF